ncbi:hypothetical protein GGR50DRAFT_693590 [Xylaria sp. CBS 124048]|nr:hypothetical protein GGR50DRAFT_693590 [Xylaria sp. CBS 124048]
MAGEFHGFSSHPHLPKLPRYNQLPVLPENHRMNGARADYEFTQALEQTPLRVTTDLLTPPGYRPRHGDRDHAYVDGGDARHGRDSRDSRDSEASGDYTGHSVRTPHSSISRRAMPRALPTALPTSSIKKDKTASTIEEQYPTLFLPLTRANVERLFDDRMLKSVTFPWKDLDVDPDRFIQMKTDLSHEIAKHFIAFSTTKGIPWAIKTTFPWLDCSTKVFQTLRTFGFHHSSHLKHDFLYEKLYTYLVRTRKKHPEIDNMTEDELVAFFGARFDQDLVKVIWAKSIRVLDVEKTFAHRDDKLGAWWLRQVFLNSCVRVLPLVISEIDLNPRLDWRTRAPSGWLLDKNIRDDLNWYMDCLCVAPEFSEVELDAFVWTPPKLLANKLFFKRRGAALKQNAS